MLPEGSIFYYKELNRWQGRQQGRCMQKITAHKLLIKDALLLLACLHSPVFVNSFRTMLNKNPHQKQINPKFNS
jgi:hypothetical protein